MRFILVRHCEPAWPAGWLDEDVGLTERGRRQAAATAAELAERFGGGENTISIISSPAQRAVETAAIIAGVLGLEVSQDDSLLGLMDDDTRRRLAEGVIDDDELVGQVAALGELAWARLLELAEASDDTASVIVASHDVTIAAVVCLAMSMPLSDFRRFRIDMGSLTVLDFRRQRQGRRIILTSLNDGCHLEGVGV